jgi:hypothetical protein
MKTSTRVFRRGPAIVVLGCALAASSSVAAATPTEAESTYATGVAAFKRHDYEAARVAFEKSLATAPRAGTLLNAALAEFYSSHPLDAVKHFRQFMAAPDAPADRVTEVRTTMLPRAEAQIGRIQIDAPAGVALRVDDASVGTAPLLEPVEVMPGPHVVVATFPTGNSSSVSLHALAGESVQARIVAEPAPTALAPPPATPIATLQATDAVPTGPLHPSSWGTAKTITVVSLAAGAVVAVGMGVAFSVKSNQDASTADSERAALIAGNATQPGKLPCATSPGQMLPAPCATLQSQIDSANSAHNLGVGFYVSGGVLAAGAVATWLLWPSSKSAPEHAWVRPMIGRTTGVELGVSF